MRFPAGLLADGVECLEGPDVDLATGDGGGCGDPVSHDVAGEDLEFTPELEHADLAVACSEIELAVGDDRRGSLAVSMDALEVDLFTGHGLHDDHHSVFPCQVEEPVVDDGGGDIGGVPAASPSQMGL